MKIRKSLLLLVIAYAGLVSHAQEAITPGKIIEQVAIEGDKTQSYSLYLPKNYDPKSKYPIVYVFDPGARGKTAVEVFADAAEKYGYIVAGSNDSRNGMGGDRLTPIFDNLWADTHRRFPVDDGRVVMAGFSGGARVASAFANGCGCALGVIGSGAGFLNGVEVSGKLPFVFFGAAGYDDPNYFELRSLSEKLLAAKATYRVEYFAGAHQWLPQSLADEALAWFELQAMRLNRREKDDAFIEMEFRKRTAAADRFLTQKNMLEAEGALRSVVTDFGGLKDTSASAEKLRSITSSGDFRKQVNLDKAAHADHKRRSAELFRLVQDLEIPELRQETLSQIRTAADGIRKRAEAELDSSSRRNARRLLDGVYIWSVETASPAIRSGNNARDGLNILELADAMRPRNAYVSYLRAQLYAIDGQKKKSIDALSKAVDFGLKNRQGIENDKRFDSFRSDPEFQKVLSRLSPD